MLAPTAIDLSSGKIDTSVNNVAPTARIYLHLICRKRHLPLKLRKGKTFRGAFTLTDTFLASARPVGAGKTDTYVNKVAPTARIYLHLICRKRHLPLKLRKGKTFRGAFLLLRIRLLR